MKWILGLFSILAFVACSSVQKVDYNQPEIEDESLDLSLVTAQQQAVDRLIAPAPQELTEAGIKDSTVAQDIKYVLNTKNDHPKVQKWIEYYSVKDRERFQTFLNRGARYKPIIQDLLITNGLPPDLYYLGILESGFVSEAISHAGAVGPWQFMGPTGRQYGLRINNYVDERIDIVRSTMAAIRYLKELYRQKKSWYLALAAYNAGPGRVRQAMRRGDSQNYWDLTSRMLLPYDTREYIPQFLAILSIGKSLEEYKFVEIAEEEFLTRELVKVPSPIQLQKIADVSGVDYSTLKKLNPHLIRDITPPNIKHYHIWVPKEETLKVAGNFETLGQHRIQGLQIERTLASYKGPKKVHRVKSGQNLATIAKQYGTSITTIKELNKLSSSKIYAGQKLKVQGKSKPVRSKAVAKSTNEIANEISKAIAYHKVRRGQNLTSIGKQYNMDSKELRQLNNLKTANIQVGQRLKVYKVAAKETKVAAQEPKLQRYRIRLGDNLHKIAKRFNTTVSDIKEINKMTTNHIQRGQYIKIAAN